MKSLFISNDYHFFLRPKSQKTSLKYNVCTLVLNSESSKFATQTYIRTIDEIFVYFYGCQYKAQIMYQGQSLALLHCTVITVNSTHILLLVQHIRTYYLCINFGMGVFIHSYYWLPLLLSRKSTIHATISLNHSLSHLYMENAQPISAKKNSPHMWLQIFDQIFVNCR